MNRWILLVVLLYSCVAVAQFFQKKPMEGRTIEGTPYCTHGEKLTIKEAPRDTRGRVKCPGMASPPSFQTGPIKRSSSRPWRRLTNNRNRTASVS